MPGRVLAPRRLTSAATTAGVAVSAACFGVAILAEIAGAEPGSGSMSDLAAVLDGLVALTPWAWASMGTFVVVLTPMAGLLATIFEYASVGDRRGIALALAVVVTLVLAAIVAIVRQA